MALGYDGKHLAAPPTSSGAAFWTRGYGAWGDFDGDGNAASAERDLGGFVSGIDARVGGTWRAGLAAGGSWSNISVGDRHSHAEVESFQLAGYAGGMAGPLALRGGGAWAWQDIDTDRAVMFPGFFERQSTSYDADTGQIFGEIAYPMASGRFAFEPFAGLAYVSVETDSFRERGGALASLNGGSDDEDVGYSTLGLRAATAMHWNTMLVIPKISAAWQHAFDDVTPGASLAFATTGIGFAIDGVPLAQDSLLLEAGLDFSISATATLGVSYSGQFADDVTDNAVKGRLTWLF
jgi:outer membrane autotransporter protein